MLRNYIKLACRNLWNSRVFSAINIIGLSAGLAVCIIIMLFVQFEKSFDSFHTKNIYRLDEVQNFEGMVQPQKVALSMYPMGPTLKNEFPEIKNYTAFHSVADQSVKNGETKIFFKKSLWTDSNFFSIFNFKLQKGDPINALRRPYSIVLTPESAGKLFGIENPMGKILETNNSMDTMRFVVTGILEKLPDNSHLQFDALYSINSYVGPGGINNWGGNWMVTYFELYPNTDIKALEKKFPAYLEKHLESGMSKRYQLFLQSLKDVHGGSSDITHDYNNHKKFDAGYTDIFSIIALVVLAIGCINFINLSTARSTMRAKEVGVRKTIGAHRLQLVIQFIGESLVLSFIAVLLAVLIVKIALPYVNNLSGHELSFSPFSDPVLIGKVLFGGLLVGILSGIYPAIYLSSFRPSVVLKGATAAGRTRSFTRNALVVSQFAGAAFLIIATIFVVKQLHFMRTRDAGFNRDHVVMLPGAYKNWYRIKDELLRNPLIKSVTGSSQRLGNNLHQRSITFHYDGISKNMAPSNITVDYDFINLFEIKMLAGRNFSREGEAREFIINESMARELLKDTPGAPFESLLETKVELGEDTNVRIIGVCRDFNFNSLHHKIESLCLFNKKGWGYNDVTVKIDGNNIAGALSHIEATWKKIIPHFPYAYQFLDEHFARLYEADKKVSEVVSILAGIAIFIACLGLFGLASYSAERRTKEIGIRKVLGATVTNVVSLLSWDFLKLIVVANLAAWPLGWIVVSKWLQNYAYHIEMSWWIFLLGGVSSMLIALLTVSAQTMKAAAANPIKSLRTE